MRALVRALEIATTLLIIAGIAFIAIGSGDHSAFSLPLADLGMHYLVIGSITALAGLLCDAHLKRP
ncbi:hypothetical protein [Luteolibacter soli]|uniref:Uncharacterized protein n=1 Tax=Luteolibacter soli TaxID=3135280 RepID=A0ABU9AWW0_9BACT